MNFRFSPLRWVSGLPQKIFLGLLLVLLVGILAARAWVGDDVFITMRVADQFVHGFGPNYNQGERVQAYTHPLWLLLLTGAYALWRDPYAVPIALSVVVSLAAVGVAACRAAGGFSGAALGLVLLAFSAAFVDYSSAGLENPLNHLLAAVFVAVLLGARQAARLPGWLALIAALAFLSRADTLLLYLPALLVVFMQRRGWNTLLQLAVGLLPVLIWEGFSLLYYGFPFPNTYYAKLTSSIPPGDLLLQGLRYLFYTRPLIAAHHSGWLGAAFLDAAVAPGCTCFWQLAVPGLWGGDRWGFYGGPVSHPFHLFGRAADYEF